MAKDFCAYLPDMVTAWGSLIRGLRRDREINAEMGGGSISTFVWFCLMSLSRCLKPYKKSSTADMIS